MVMIDQVCWNEMNVDEELTLRCEEPECRGYEDFLRRTLFQWKRFPVDMVVEPFLRVPKAVSNTGFGVGVQEEVAVGDPTNSDRRPPLPEPVPDRGGRGTGAAAAESAATPRRRSAGWRSAHEVLRRPAGRAVGGRGPVPVALGPDQHLDERRGRALGPGRPPELMHKLVGRVTEGHARRPRSARGAGPALRPAERHPLHRRLDRRTAGPRLRPGDAPREGPLDVRPRADVLHGVAAHVQGLRGGLRRPRLRALRARLLRLLRPARPQDRPRCA